MSPKKLLTFLISAAALIVIVVGVYNSFHIISAGYVGIKVNYAGGDRGVSDIPLVTGWAYANPFTQKIFEYPTFVQTAAWTKDKNEGRPFDESIFFNTKDGAVVGASISVSYQLREVMIPRFYVKFRSDDLEKFTHGYLRNVARDAFSEEGGTFSAEEINGPKKAEFLDSVRKKVNRSLDSIGVVIEQFGLINNLDLPASIVEAINNKIAATQNAIAAENQLRQAEAEAKKTVAKAEGEAQANRALTASITTQLLEWQKIQLMQNKWDGKLPQVMSGSGAGLMLNLGGK